MQLPVSVIFPILNCVHLIQKNAPHIIKLSQTFEELIFVDGGSTDATIDQLKKVGLENYKLVQTEKGRGNQLYHGALNATQNWFLIIHIDSFFLQTQSEIFDQFKTYIETQIEQPIFFTLRFQDDSEKARIIEKRIQWRVDNLCLPYGDQGLFIQKNLYNQIGGFNPSYPIFEDVDLVLKIIKHAKKRRKKKGKLQALIQSDLIMQTSPIRFQKRGYFKRSALNIICLLLFFLRVHPKHILKLYLL